MQIPKTINDGLAFLPPSLDTEEARTLLAAIGFQESGFRTRLQDGGPAVSYWQFEQGGVRGVLTHPASARMAIGACSLRGVSATVAAVYQALKTDDLLAVAFARLLLYTHPRALPASGDQAAGWAYYEWLWRPGKPRPKDWPDSYAAALKTLEGATHGA